MTVMTDSRSGAVINVLYDYDCQNREEWNADFRLPIEEPPERSQKVQRYFSRSPSKSAASHIKPVATQERDNTSARGVLLRPFLNNGYRLRKAVMSQFFFTF